jgi:tetrahydromethanopterin S-methyltransferase subunit G
MSKETPNSKDIYQRLAILETKVDEIISNHLKHLDSRMTRIESRQLQILGGIVLTLIGVVVSILVKL